MTEGPIVVIAPRLPVPLVIPRFPLAGGLPAMAVEGLDVVIVEQILSGGMGSHYHHLAFEARVATRWAAGPARPAGLAGLLARGEAAPVHDQRATSPPALCPAVPSIDVPAATDG